MPDDNTERGTLADAPFKTAVARVNIPDPHNPGMRIVGYRVSADEAQLSDALFVLSARDAAHRKVRDDAERLTELRARRPLDWPGLDFLLAQIDARDAALRDARAQEREACAKIADLYAENPPSGDDNNTQAAFDLGMNHMAGCMDAATFIAEAIRDPARLAVAPDGGGWRHDRPGAYWVRFRETGPWQICHWITPDKDEEPYWTSWLAPVEIGPYIPRPAGTMVTPRNGGDHAQPEPARREDEA